MVDYIRTCFEAAPEFDVTVSELPPAGNQFSIHVPISNDHVQFVLQISTHKLIWTIVTDDDEVFNILPDPRVAIYIAYARKWLT